MPQGAALERIEDLIRLSKEMVLEDMHIQKNTQIFVERTISKGVIETESIYTYNKARSKDSCKISPKREKHYQTT